MHSLTRTRKQPCPYWRSALTSKKEYRWTVAPAPPAELVKQLSDELTITPSLVSVLINRGIDTFDKAKRYFRPSIDQLHDPFLMDGMHLAVERLIKARDKKEKILVYGDYDVDGTNGAGMLYLYFKEIGCDVTYYIPDRLTEGYGISQPGVEFAKKEGVTLLISIDCGITALAQVEYANQLGMEVIICDHHEPADELPNAVAILDALKPNCRYPFKSLCGTGVGYKYIQAIARTLGHEEKVEKYVDFVALATTADIVPLVDENRIFVRLGLERINNHTRPGIRALLESAGLKIGAITTGQVVFAMAPRINAVGRLGDAKRAVELLVSDDYHESIAFARVLEQENLNRRKIDEGVFIEAQALVEQYFKDNGDGAIVMHQPKWHPGVVGIVASRMVEKYYRPAVMLTTLEGVAKGSARSISGVNIHQALKMVEDKLLQFGGHKYAAGLSVDLDRVDEFRVAFNAAVKGMLTEELLTPVIHIDTEIDLAELTPKYMRILKQCGPFGPQNMRPTYLTKGVQVVGTPRIVGKDHLRFKIKKNGVSFDCIGFGLGGMMDLVKSKMSDLDLVFSIDENDFTGVTLTQLKIKDLK
ncbi:MAG: single-stranded-DNA-specific exonuclease RecJ [Bacteroidetes bacterium]|nr:single-stranded-DNA-specific exonuclease RecJ [Bacteroidota bacterium]